MRQQTRDGRLKGALAGLLFLAIVLVAFASLDHNRQLGMVGGLADRWLELGANIATHHTFGEGREPSLFKAPGYAAFVAAVLWASDCVPRPAPPRPLPPETELAEMTAPYDSYDMLRAAQAVYRAQAFVLAATGVLLFLWLSRTTSTVAALGAAIVFGTNPYSVVLVGVLNYALLNLLGLVATAWTLDVALGSKRRVAPLVLAGAVCGLAALVRSTLLVMPLFVLAVARLQPRSWGGAARAGLAFACGMSVAVLPWTARNFVWSGHFVPVNAQFWSTFFGATARAAPADANVFRWKLVRSETMEVQTRVGGKRERGWEPYGIRENLALEDEFRRASAANLRVQPLVYVRNATESLRTFLVDINWSLLRVFQYLQTPEARWQNWFQPGADQRIHPPKQGKRFELFVRVLSVLAAVGVLLGARRRDTAALVIAAGLTAQGVVHTLVWMDFMYYNVKLPWIVAGAFYAVDRGTALASTNRLVAGAWNVGLSLLLVAWSWSLTAAVLRIPS